MSGVSKRGLEEQQPNEEKTELYDGMGSWGDERPFKLARKEPREHERRMPIPQSQSPWQQPQHSRSSYSSFYLEPSHTHDIKEREVETQVKAVEGKDEIKESKIDIKLEPREIKDAHHEIKDPKVGIKDQHHHHNHHHYQYPQLESERIGDRDIVMEDGEFIGENRVGDWKKEERKRKEEGASERKEKDKKKEDNVKDVEVKEEIVEAEGKDIDEKERKKERESQEKKMKQHIQDREGLDDGICDGEGGSERDRGDSFGHGPPSLQRNKRMQRSRAHSMTGRDVRSRFKPKDNDGLPGRSESSAVVYKVGESMQETIKLWKEFEASQALKCGENSSVSYPTLEIRIPAEHVTTANHQVRGSQLWGTDIYTDDSDLVAVLMHTGYYRPTVIQPPQTIHELRAVIVVLPPQDSYISTLRNSVRSRAWGAASGCSYKVDKCRLMKKGGGSIELEPFLVRVSAVAPTLALAATERSMTTRAAASNAYRQHRFVREVTIQYNLCNEPWMKYSIGIVADRGLKKSQFTSARLKKGEVLYVETHKNRYELSYDGEKVFGNGSVGANTATLALAQTANNSERADKAVTNENEKHLPTISQNGDKSLSKSTNEVEKTQNGGDAADRYKWARCKQPLPQTVLKQIGIPLAPEHIEVLEENLDWEELQWSQTSVWIRGKEYVLARAHFMSFN